MPCRRPGSLRPPRRWRFMGPMRTNRSHHGLPRPAYGPSQDGRDDLQQGLLSLGVSGDGGFPVRLGLRDGHRRESVETPLAMEACLA
jgi:hypothetical protein